MNCREFRRNHDAYVDDTLSGIELDAMSLHLRFCQPCSQLDTRVRRALFLAHNLPMIEPSEGFGARLELRLRHERALMATGALSGVATDRRRPFAPATYAALAAGILLAAGVAATATTFRGEERTIRLAPVVATLPESEPSPFATSVMVASMPAGLSVWPAVFVAQQAPWHYASDAAGR